MAIKDEGDLTDAERRGLDVAREIGALQKQARELERAKPVRRVDWGPPNVLFRGGATESSEAEDADEAFRAADILRSRRVRETQGEIVRYKSGAKKGQPRFNTEGGLSERNRHNLQKRVGKKVRVRVDYDQITDGRITKSHYTHRTITYRDYGQLVRTYQDMMRTVIRRKSPDAYYVKLIRWAIPKTKKAKGKRKRAAKGNATAGNAAV